VEGLVAAVAIALPSRFAPTAEFWRGRRVFLTGHTGFKGAWLTLWLTSLGAEVRGYALAPESTPNIYAALALDGMCESSIADIRDDERLTHVLRDFRPDIAIHMAAQSLVRRSYVIPAETFAVNVQGTVNFFDACRHADSLRASIVVTTDKCYENREWLLAYREDDPLGGRDPSARAKPARNWRRRPIAGHFSPTGSPWPWRRPVRATFLAAAIGAKIELSLTRYGLFLPASSSPFATRNPSAPGSTSSIPWPVSHAGPRPLRGGRWLCHRVQFWAPDGPTPARALHRGTNDCILGGRRELARLFQSRRAARGRDARARHGALIVILYAVAASRLRKATKVDCR
jgi:hypothetical protein